MSVVRRVVICCALFSALSTSLVRAAEPQVIQLWPGQAPGEKGPFAAAESDQPAKDEPKGRVQRRQNVSVPTLTVYPADPAKATGTSMIIAPGGGYNILAWDLEGTEVAEWLNTLGVTAFVLKYRVPKRPDDPTNNLPFMDAQRAVRIVRSRASEWKLDPDKIGMLGFSAGGNLTAKTACMFDTKAFDGDDLSATSPRPNFAVLVYPAYLQDKKDPMKLAPELVVSDKTPPMIMIHAGDDRIDAQGSILMYQALKANKVQAELHVYGAGGHGYGLRKTANPVHTWPERVAAWMVTQKLIPEAK
jgi:acetyl esterase/lipase